MKRNVDQVELAKLEPVDKLTTEEREFHQAMMSREAEFHSDSKTINKYAEVFKNHAKQRKAISLRLPKQDYFAIKAKAVQLGLPYQALINSLIHRYVNGDL
jgi:predicted DNA binding CopG/RHH family protein